MLILNQTRRERKFSFSLIGLRRRKCWNVRQKLGLDDEARAGSGKVSPLLPAANEKRASTSRRSGASAPRSPALFLFFLPPARVGLDRSPALFLGIDRMVLEPQARQLFERFGGIGAELA